jgi:hypothetical protein
MRSRFYLLKITVLLFGLALLGGCTTIAMNSAVDSWQNRQLPEVVGAWGTPSEELNVDGQHLFLWNTYNGILASPGSPKPAQPADSKYCMRLLQVDRTDKIIYGNWEGNDCPGFFSGWRR